MEEMKVGIGSLAGEKVTLCVYPSGKVLCIDGTTDLGQVVSEFITDKTIGVIGQGDLYLALRTNPSSLGAERALVLPPNLEDPCLENKQTPIYFGKKVPTRGYGPIMKTHVCSISSLKTVVTGHKHHVVFHSLENFSAPAAVIKLDKLLVDFDFNWDFSTPPPYFRSMCPEYINYVLQQYFVVNCVLLGDDAKPELHQIPFFLPAVGEMTLPQGVVSVLCLLYDMWQNDRQGPLVTLFANGEKLTRMSDTSIYLKAEYKGYQKASRRVHLPVDDADLTMTAVRSQFKFSYSLKPGESPLNPCLTVLLPIEPEKKLPNAPTLVDTASILEKLTTASKITDTARKAVSEVQECGFLQSAFARLPENPPGQLIEEEILSYAVKLQKICKTVIGPIEKSSRALLSMTGTSFGDQLPSHTCAVRNRIKNLIDVIASSVNSCVLRDREICERLETIKVRQQTIMGSLKEVHAKLRKRLVVESYAAVLEVLGDYFISGYDAPPRIIPNIRGLKEVFLLPNLTAKSENVMDGDKCISSLTIDSTSYKLNHWLRVLEMSEKIDNQI